MSYNRYTYSNTIIDSQTKKRRKETIIYSTIPKNIDDIYLISKIGDRLDLLAEQFYKDVNKWTLIARANNIGKGTLEIIPGTQIRIPASINLIDDNDRNINK